MKMTYHVAKTGMDHNPGSQKAPFLTINKAASLAQPGDTVVVHQGVYREWVKPARGGITELSPITYQAGEGEKVVIKGSEVVDEWVHVEGSVWKTQVPNQLFGDYNPYAEHIYGDWFCYPEDWKVHAGDVYLEGHSFYEAKTLKDLKEAQVRKIFKMPLSDRIEVLPYPEDTIYQWYPEVSEEITTIYVNFQDKSPETALVEINVRKSCFHPIVTGLNYITVRGFEMCHAANPWSPPTADQIGLIGPNWAKGWVIEDNHIHNAKCSAITLGKTYTTGDNASSKTQQKSGYQYQQEAIFAAYQQGWSKETVGSHTVRNNVIHDCGQNGINGMLGCIFSEIYGNHIYNIGIKYEYFGWEIAGIKFHTPLDVVIEGNRVHDCTLGLWLDWEAQGTFVNKNLLYRNNRDCTIEVTHGPLIFSNNLLASSYNFDNHAQGTAFINNLFAGTMSRKKILDRATPYHYPHSTQIKGYAFVYSGDERLYNNIFIGGPKAGQDHYSGTGGYNDCHAGYEEWMDEIVAKGMRDEDKYAETEQPVYIDGNVYLKGAEPFRSEVHHCTLRDEDPFLRILEENDKVYMEMTLPSEALQVKTEVHGTDTLGTVRLLDAIYDKPHGGMVLLDEDYKDQLRNSSPLPGPFEGLVPGFNRIRIW